jgi:hypothetical protein
MAQAQVNIKDQAAVEAMLDEAQKNCSARLVSYQDITSLLLRIEAALTKRGVPKKYWPGTAVKFQSGERTSKKWASESTHVDLVAGTAGRWFVARVFRSYAPDFERFYLQVPDDATAAAVEKLRETLKGRVYAG